MISQIKKFFYSSASEIIAGISPIIGGVLFSIITVFIYPVATTSNIAFAFVIGAIISLIIAVIFIYNIQKKSLRGIFIKKLILDVNNFADSNTSVVEANRRMLYDSKVILNLTNLEDNSIIKDKFKTLTLVRDWLKEGLDKDIYFTDVMNRRGLEHIATELANNVRKSITVDKLKINTSISATGCVALIEKMREYGVPIEHNFCDIDGITQSENLSSTVKGYSASLIPFSAIYLSSNRMDIIEKYKYLCPITYDEQIIVGKRNTSGEFSIKNIECQKRGAGHYQLITMMADKEFKINENIPIDLSNSKNNIIDSIALYQPIAKVYRGVKEQSEHWGYINNKPFPIDVILVVNNDDFGVNITSFQSLAIVLMAMMKSDLSKTKTFGNKLYNNKKYRVAFEKATENFANILK